MTMTSGWWRRVTPRTLQADVIAGLLGALLVLPQGIAFATLAGLPPQYGLYSAIVPTIVAAVFGSSSHVVSGPTNANSLAMFAAISPIAIAGSSNYIALALAVTIMVGIIQFAVGALRLGSLTDFLSPAVLLGFTSGAAALIACYALPDMLGLPSASGHGPGAALLSVIENWRSINWAATSVGLATLAAAVGLRAISRKIPFMLIGLLVGWALSEVLNLRFGGDSVSVIGAIPTAVPTFAIPEPPLQDLARLASVAAALAVIALGQSVSIAKAVAARSGERIDVNREFVGQGLSNVFGGLSSSYLSCGSLNRSLPNFEAGAQTPAAAIFAAVALMALVGVAAPLLRQLPTAAIAGLLIYTAWSLLDFSRFVELARLNRVDFAIAATTFGAMAFLPFHFAIMLGAGMSLAAYLQRTSRPHFKVLLPDPSDPSRRFSPLDEFENRPAECPQLKMLRIEGATYYGATQFVGDKLHELRLQSPGQKHLLVMARSMNFVDLAGAELWRAEAVRRRAAGGDLYFHRPRTPVIELWTRTGFLKWLGADHIFNSKTQAISEIYRRLDPSICKTCKVRAFLECNLADQPRLGPAETAPANSISGSLTEVQQKARP
ncbi:MAG: sulfate transporter [Ancylobacter novellus]|uniref:Sulfate transporter n=1 Tax=Ancylobacter novellus TaxID=921 RepID=A0A2W5KT01_ANCNO|nr:MAG: sulfate transporter [Ancylobacter novellus]